MILPRPCFLARCVWLLSYRLHIRTTILHRDLVGWYRLPELPCVPISLLFCCLQNGLSTCMSAFLSLRTVASLGLCFHLSVCLAVCCLHVCLTVQSACLQDPVDASPAVLVKKYDITQQKELELKLSVQQQELQRCNAALFFIIFASQLCRHPHHCSRPRPRHPLALSLLQPLLLTIVVL